MNTYQRIKVKVMSRYDLERANECWEKVKLISISDINGKSAKLSTDILERLNSALFIRFDDVESDSINCISTTEAEAINLFVESGLSDIDKIIVSCPGGVCRSAAVAAAIKLKLHQSDMDIWGNGKYCPNMTVFNTMLLAIYGDNINPNISIEDRENLNIRLWRERNNIE